MGIKKLLSVATFLVAGSLAHTAWAQTDVTSTYLTNADFDEESSWVTTNANVTSGGNIQEVASWTKNSSSWSGSATIGYGTSGQCNGSAVPGTNPEGVTEGGALAFSGSWSGTVQYTQAVTLPAGIYTISYNAYNAQTSTDGNNKIANNLIGFIADAGGQFYGTKTTFAKQSWENETFSFVLTTSTSGKISVGASFPHASSSVTARLFVDGITLTYKSFDEVTEDAPVDFTSMANNTVAGWTFNGSNRDRKITNFDGQDMVQCYSDNYYTGDAMTQIISGLPTGIYNVEVYCQAQLANWNNHALVAEDGATDITFLKVNDQSRGIPVYQDKNARTKTLYTLNDVKVTDGNITVKVTNEKEGANWILANIKTIMYLGADLSLLEESWTTNVASAEAALADETYNFVTGEERTILAAKAAVTPVETVKGYNDAIGELTIALNTFKAAKTNYDNLVVEIAKAKALGIADADDYSATEAYTSATALEKTQALKVAEYEYVTGNYAYGVALGEWTSEATGTKAANFSNEHWSGTTHTYKNQDDSNGQGWNANSWSINFNQNVTLPAGDYVFKVAARQASGDQVNTTLIVKNGETILGSVSDFPRSSKSLGINKEGATSFNRDDPAGFANNGDGFGWEWRYVKFTLTEAAIVNIAINSVATAKYQWVSFGDYTLQTNNEANIAMIEYNIALNDANLALANNTYSVVTGSERDNLTTAINANPGTTAETINAAIEALNAATKAFTDAKASYDDLNAAKTEISAELPYASADKYEALNTAVEAVPANAEDAVAKASAIRTANRLYVESNAMAEGVVDAVDMTSFITNPNFTVEGVGSDEGWTSSQSGGSKGVIDGEPLTDGNGVTHRYYDYWNGSANNQHVTQVVKNLPAGRYLFTVSARADANLNNVFVKIGDKQTVVNKIGSTGGTFGRGWNDYTVVYDNDKVQDVTLEIYSTSEGGNKAGWFGFTRARLVKIAEAANMSISEAQYGTFVAPFEVEIPEGVTASKITGIDANGYTVVEEVLEGTIPANTPVILFSEAVVNTTFYGTAVEGTATAGLLTGNLTGETINAPMNSYILLNGANGVGFYRVVTEDVTVSNNRVYLTVPPTAEAKAFISFGDATAINGVTDGATEVVRYNAAGVKVNAPVKGLNIVKMSDGTVKKVMVK